MSNFFCSNSSIKDNLGISISETFFCLVETITLLITVSSILNIKLIEQYCKIFQTISSFFNPVVPLILYCLQIIFKSGVFLSFNTETIFLNSPNNINTKSGFLYFETPTILSSLHLSFKLSIVNSFNLFSTEECISSSFCFISSDDNVETSFISVMSEIDERFSVSLSTIFPTIDTEPTLFDVLSE